MIYLASNSPRRAQLLRQIGVAFEVLSVDIDETRQIQESPTEYVRRLALEKARQGRQQLGAEPRHPVLAADTTVVLEDQIFNKPLDKNKARMMLQKLAGKEHTVHTAVAVVADQQKVDLHTSRVMIRNMTEVELDAYVKTEEGLDKAGAYAVQGKAAIFISSIEGSFSGIMGLPLFETANLLQTFNISVLNL